MAKSQGGLWVTDPEAYRAKMTRLAGDRDRITILSQTADILVGIVREHSVEQLRRRPFEGKWTPNEIIGHLADAEWVFGFRMRLILCEDRPKILGMDQDLWAAGQRHNQREPLDLVAEFRALRDINRSLWERMTPEDLQRTGQHDERGPESLDTILTLQAGHDLSHIDQIRRYLGA